jgi:hypothetical protein
MFVREYGYTLSEHDPDRPWIVRSIEHRTVTLDDGVSFQEWARQNYPAPRWSVEPDPWQLSQTLWPQ